MFGKRDAEPPPIGDLERHRTVTIPSSAKVVAYDLINRENATIGERRLFALVDAAVSVLVHEGREETARLALETVVGPRVALAAVRILAGDDKAL